MLLNGEHSLQSWPMDSISESVSLLEGDEYLAVSILSRANQIQNNLANLETADPENGDLFDDAYVSSHYIAGFGKIIKSEKIHHLGSLAELIADLARQFHSYSDHSMIYLTGLIVEKLIEVCEDLVSGNSLETDISDVVGECAIYLKSAIELVERQKREKRENRAALVSQIALETPPDIAPTNLSDDIFVEIDTEEVPEKIIIDPERIGLISDFCEEVWDSLQKSENLLIELENNPTSKDLINELFRAVHTIKGGSRLLEIKKIEKLSHELETVLDEVRSNRKTLDANMIDVALDCVKRIHNITEEVASREPINTKVNDLILKLRGNVASSITIKKSTNTDISKNINETSTNQEKQNLSDGDSSKSARVLRDDSIKVSAEKLDSVLNASSEVYITRIRLENDKNNLSNAINFMDKTIEAFKKDFDNWLIKNVDLGLIEKNFNKDSQIYDEELLENFKNKNHTESVFARQSDLVVGIEKLSIQNRNIQKNVEDLEVLSSRLQSGAMNFRMVPISTLFNRFPAQVRDIARQIGKRVDLKISGNETELDKILINQLSDPLLHLIRNSIDHGIEEPQKRIEMNKEEVGKINLRAYYMGSNAVIEIEDDGKGIDSNVILKKALDKGLISESQKASLSEKEILDLIFEPGFSSAEFVTELSGRGVGMDVVKTSISRMQGSIKLQSTVNSGTLVTLRLPLTLAVVGIILVSENGYEFAFPILNVDEIIRINLTKDVARVNETLVYNFRSELVAVNYLSDFLGYPKRIDENGENFLLILNDGENKIGVIVDSVLGQQNVLLKQLGSLIETAPFVIGCTILSNSKLVLILNVIELTQRNVRSDALAVYEKIESGDKVRSQRNQNTVMIVDDSRLQRSRLCSFLENAGYKIIQASDGYEALKLSEKEIISAFCIDIEMPLMDGYQLIQRLKLQPKYQDVPIFVISGLNVTKDNLLSMISNEEIQNFFAKPVDLNSLLVDLDQQCLTDQVTVSLGITS